MNRNNKYFDFPKKFESIKLANILDIPIQNNHCFCAAWYNLLNAWSALWQKMWHFVVAYEFQHQAVFCIEIFYQLKNSWLFYQLEAFWGLSENARMIIKLNWRTLNQRIIFITKLQLFFPFIKNITEILLISPEN